MKPEEVEYMRWRLQRAQETLSEACLMMGSGLLYGAVNRVYYACFHALSVLLYTENDYPSKHSGAISLFDRKWIKTGRLPVDMSKFYHMLFDNRQKSDYGDRVVFQQQEVGLWITEAELFVGRISAVVEQAILESEQDDT